jgi:adenosylhomocysteine nucleosidase
MPIAAVTGLAAEAMIARSAGWRAAAAGGDAARTAAAIERLIAQGATRLVSFGICGGLEPALGSGSVLLPRAVLDEAGKRIAVERTWHEAAIAGLAQAGIAVATGDMLGAASIVATPERKQAMHESTGAVAVDLESHLVARASTQAGLPFLVLRAVADPAGRSLPPAAQIGLDADGRPALHAVFRSLVNNPAQIPALLRAALEARRALAALRCAAAALADR